MEEEYYKCPRCGNEEEFKVWSWVYHHQVLTQTTDPSGKREQDWSNTNELGDSHTDEVRCNVCHEVVADEGILLNRTKGKQ